jgi:hypothetical protein
MRRRRKKRKQEEGEREGKGEEGEEGEEGEGGGRGRDRVPLCRLTHQKGPGGGRTQNNGVHPTP